MVYHVVSTTFQQPGKANFSWNGKQLGQAYVEKICELSIEI